MLRTLLQVPLQKKFIFNSFHVKILLILSLTFTVLKNSYLIRFMLGNSKF